MKPAFRKLVLSLAIASSLGATGVAAAADKVVIGFVGDMSGPYSAPDGPGGVEAVRMAVADFGGKVLGQPIEVIFADHSNRADIASNKAREWYDRSGANVVFGAGASPATLAMNKVAAEKKQVYFAIGTGSEILTNEECHPYGVHYAFDSVSVARTAALAAPKGKTWFLIVPDYSYGHAFERQVSELVKADGGKVLGAVKHPAAASDFSSFMLQAAGMKPDVLGIGNAGADTINTIKSAKEFGLTNKMQVVASLMYINDIHGLGLETAGGMFLTDNWYWDMNEKTRSFAKRYFERMKQMPSSLQAANYSATTTYLKAVQAAGSVAPDAVMAKIKSLEIDDVYAKGYVRGDGNMIHARYLMQVKTAAESKGPWDYLKVVKEMSGEDIYNTKEESKCAAYKAS